MKRETLKKTEIIRDNITFGKILKEGRWYRGRNFILYHLDGEMERKVGFTVSSKVKGKVKRNFIKRRLREIYRKNKDLLPSKGFFIFMGLEGALKAPMEEILADLKRISKIITSE